MLENTDQNNSEYGHFSRSEGYLRANHKPFINDDLERTETVVRRCSATLLKTRLRHRCFPKNFEKILKTFFWQKTSKTTLSERTRLKKKTFELKKPLHWKKPFMESVFCQVFWFSFFKDFLSVSCVTVLWWFLFFLLPLTLV